MDEQLKTNLTSRRQWLRLVFMVLFALVLQVALLVMWAVVALQFLWALVTGMDNDKLRRFGYSLAAFIEHALQFLTYNTEQKPFPFSDWPDMPPKREEIVDVDIVEPTPAPGTAAPSHGSDEAVNEAVKETIEEAVDEARNATGTAGEPKPDTDPGNTGKNSQDKPAP